MQYFLMYESLNFAVCQKQFEIIVVYIDRKFRVAIHNKNIYYFIFFLNLLV